MDCPHPKHIESFTERRAATLLTVQATAATATPTTGQVGSAVNEITPRAASAIPIENARTLSRVLCIQVIQKLSHASIALIGFAPRASVD
jgi:hypothetical protein